MKKALASILLILALVPCSAQEKENDKVMHEVVVTATGTEHLLKNAPVQTEVISRRQLETYAGKSIEDILAGLTASFAFDQGDMGSQMQLNGLGNNYILILVNGKRLHGDNGGENDLGLIDPHNIERIEIVKGAQSALYGSDAIAGVVNIITKKPHTEGILLENTTRAGMYADVRQHNSVVFTMGKLTSQTNFQLQHSDGWQNTGDEYTEAKVVHDSRNKTVNKFTNWQVSERLNYSLTNNVSLYAEGWYYNKIINRPTNGLYPSCDVHTYDLKYNNASAAIGGEWKLKGQDRITLDIDWNMHDYFYKYTARTYEDAYVEGVLEHGVPFYKGQQRLQSDQQRAMAELKGVFSLPKGNLLNVGAEYRFDYLKAPMRVKGGNASDWTAAVYAQDEFSYKDWLNVTAGVRLINNESFGFHVTPKLSAMVALGDFRIRAGWSSGFKTPTPKELNYHYLRQMGSNTFYYMGNKDLRPQTSNYWSLNAEYRSKRLTVSVTGYYNRLGNMIALVNVPDSVIPVGETEFGGDGSGHIIPRMYKNAEDARTYGADLNVSYKITKELTIGGNYAYLNTDAHVYDEAHDRLKQVVIDGMAHHKWNANVTWNHRFTDAYRLGVGLYTRGSSKRYYENNGNGKAYQTWRISTTHDFGKMERPLSYRVELGVDNIFNYKDTTMRPYHLGTTTPGTTVYATFGIKFNHGKRLKSNITNHKNLNTDED